MKEIERLESVGETLNTEEATVFRALAASANYLALDRPDTAFSTKEICRYVAPPTRTSVQRLKRLARYIVHHSRVQWFFNFQPMADMISAYVDTDVSQGATGRGAIPLVAPWCVGLIFCDATHRPSRRLPSPAAKPSWEGSAAGRQQPSAWNPWRAT